MFNYKIIYNNFQYNECNAWVRFMEKQAEDGYYICNLIGRFGDFMVFRKLPMKKSVKYALCCKYLDSKIDTEINYMKDAGWEKVCENIQYIIFELPGGIEEERRVLDLQQYQNTLLSIPVRKSRFKIYSLIFLALIVLIIKAAVLSDGMQVSDFIKYLICILLNVNFVLYFMSDYYDIRKGMAEKIDHIWYFNDRTKLKSAVYHLADICRMTVLLGGLLLCIGLSVYFEDMIFMLEVIKIWLVIGFLGCAYRLMLRRSNIVLVLISMCLILFS